MDKRGRHSDNLFVATVADSENEETHLTAYQDSREARTRIGDHFRSTTPGVPTRRWAVEHRPRNMPQSL
jgi:hypothetical protein